MMFTEETPKDLSVKPNTEETEDKSTEEKSGESTTETSANNGSEDTIDLSVKKKTEPKDEPKVDPKDDPKVEPKAEPKEEPKAEPMELSKADDSGAEPMEVTLDLSMPSSSVDSSTEKSNAQNQDVVSDRSESTSPVEHVTVDTETSHITNGNHVNGYTASDDSVSMNVDEEVDLPLSPQVNRLSGDELRLKQRKMRRLKQELRNEEMKLVLLKKLRQSQLMKENIVTNIVTQPPVAPSAPPPPQPPVSHPVVKMMTNNHMSSRNGSVERSHLPAPTQPNHTGHGHSRSSGHNSKGHSVLNPPYHRNSHSSLSHAPFPPPLGLGQRNNSSNHMPTAAHSQPHSQPHSRPGPLSSLNRTPVTTPPNVVLGYPVQDLRAQQNHSSNSLLSSHQSFGGTGLATGSPGPMSHSSEVTQTPAQRQAAAKLALRKQLEKTLLQIPPPKPPPPEMHFIPNANNQEFVYYLGLETVVDFLTDSPNQNKAPPEPFECVQCGTDFTPVWKWQDRIDTNRDRPAVICETCVTSNIKKALKAEHTNRLKTAFVKALQQEQEIEQRIASGATSPPLPAMSPPQQNNNNINNSYNPMNHSVGRSSPLVTSSQSHLPQAPPAHSSMPRLTGSAANAAAAAAAVASSAALLQQMPKLSAAHQSLFAAQAQQLHQLAQSLPQPQPAHMLPFGPLLAAQAYSYSMLGKSGVPSTDLHRQYLLDMIPPRSLPQGSINWKT